MNKKPHLAKRRDKVRKFGKSLWKGWIQPLALISVIVLPLKSSFADWNWVPSGSMKPTIMEGDMVWVNKLAYDLKVPFTLKRIAGWGDPVKGDVVVFFSPGDGIRMVKRVVAGPGDTLAMRNNVLFLNGDPLSYRLESIEPFRSEIHEDQRAVVVQESIGEKEHLVLSLPGRNARRDFPAVTLRTGQYFVMGDSRDNSRDSRYFGLVDRKQIVGRAEGIVISMDKNHSYLPRFSRFLSKLDG